MCRESETMQAHWVNEIGLPKEGVGKSVVWVSPPPTHPNVHTGQPATYHTVHT
jgi:hypothetical protein